MSADQNWQASEVGNQQINLLFPLCKDVSADQSWRVSDLGSNQTNQRSPGSSTSRTTDDATAPPTPTQMGPEGGGRITLPLSLIDSVRQTQQNVQASCGGYAD